MPSELQATLHSIGVPAECTSTHWPDVGGNMCEGMGRCQAKLAECAPVRRDVQ